MTLGLATAYILTLGVVYYAFVRWYRASKSRDVVASTGPTEWFEDGHPSRAAYFKLYDAMPDELGASEIKKLKAALLVRAKANVRRVLSLREDRATLAHLLRNGAIGDDLWAEFTKAEEDINLEIQECMREAEDLQRGWGNGLFGEASQAIQEEAQRIEAEQQRILAERQREANLMRAMQEAAARKQAEAAGSDNDDDVEEIVADPKPKPAAGPRRGSTSSTKSNNAGPQRRNSAAKVADA
ncbi:Translocation protein S66 [Blastocladiella emersonii ATCC 22665]|nr:Translocation protein S66 [Blastocladiella emersonii ATCC 22665]